MTKYWEYALFDNDGYLELHRIYMNGKTELVTDDFLNMKWLDLAKMLEVWAHTVAVEPSPVQTVEYPPRAKHEKRTDSGRKRGPYKSWTEKREERRRTGKHIAPLYDL